jgi:hypothetical protein
VDLGEVDEQLVVGRGRLGGGQDLVGPLEAAQLVQGLAQQEAGLGGHPVGDGRLAQPLDGRVVLAVAGQPGRPDEQLGVGRPAGVEAGRGHADGVAPAPRPEALDAIHVLQQ